VNIRRGLLTLLLVAWVFGPATAAEQDPPGLRVLKARIRFGKARVGKPPADSVDR
jgi:hypothetical protein